MKWQDEYKSKLVTAQEAVKVVKSGDRIVNPFIIKDVTLSRALFERRKELKGVKIHRMGHGENPGWLDPGHEEAFDVTLALYVGDSARPALDDKRADFQPGIFSLEFKTLNERPPEDRKDVDVLFVVTSPPDRNGFCSFGYDRWAKKNTPIKPGSSLPKSMNARSEPMATITFTFPKLTTSSNTPPP